VKCKRCNNIQELFVDRSRLVSARQEILSKPCPACGAVDYETVEKDIVDYLEEMTIMTGSKLEIISGRTEEGAQLGSLGKIGALLRFRPSSSSA
jgi:peptide chain release factor subunit 1